MSMKNRDEMIDWIEQSMRFVRTSEEFHGREGGIWVSGEDRDTYKGMSIYEYYSEDHHNRDIGVSTMWEEQLNKMGWYSEWHDPGTVLIWPM